MVIDPANSVRTASVSKTRVFVVGAYVPNGGTYMAYHLARMLHLDFACEVTVVIVGEERAANGIFHYDPELPVIGREAMEEVITADDLLIANPSFSHLFFGLRLAGQKLMYVQHFNTYPLLDRNFDHYVCVSNIVARFVATVYGFSAPVIPAFIELDRFPTPLPWRDRPAGSILVHLKGDPTFSTIGLAKLREAVARCIRGVDLDNVIGGEPMCHADFVARLGTCRYFLSLSPAEGFGLVPLEAMAMGTTVIGLDGFGGRDYMRSGQNCLVTSYPDIDGVAERLVTALELPGFAERLAEAGRITASRFTYGRFRAAWHDQFRRFLYINEPPCQT